MSTIIEPGPKPRANTTPEAPRAPESAAPLANASLLEDQFPAWLKAPKALAVLTGVLGFIYFVLSRLAIQNSDVWGHLAYGRWMTDSQALPATEPLLTLCQGVPWVDVAWLSKVAGFWTFEHFGVGGLQFLHAATLTTAFAVLAWSLYRRTVSTGWTVVGLLAFAVVAYQQLLIQRPQDFGLACFAITVACGLSQSNRKWVWVALPLMFAVWANCHASFVVGLVALGAIAAGRLVDVWRKTGSLGLALRSRMVWRPLLLMQLGASAALFNPVGLKIYADVLAISSHPNLKPLFDWQPLTLRMPQGMAFVALSMLLAAAYRLSPRRVSTAEVLLLIGFGCGALWSVRMIVWWGWVAGCLLALHGAAAYRRWQRMPVVPAAPERRGLWTVTTVGLTWIFFAYSPFGLQRIHGMPEGDEAAAEFRNNVVARTPLDAVAYLTSNAADLPAGVMYNSQEWGDYLLWAAPPQFQPMVHSHVHLIPTEVWDDYLPLHDGSGFPTMLDRYGVNTVLVDTTNYSGLIRVLRDSEEWKEVFQDPAGLAVLFVRKRPV
jgi:hypothetical protein